MVQPVPAFSTFNARNTLRSYSAIYLACALFVLGIICKGEWAGWILLSISYVLLFSFKETQVNRNLLLYLILIVTARHAFSLAIIYFFPQFGEGSDYEMFHRLASNRVITTSSFFDWQNEFGTQAYVWFLSKWYWLFGESRLIGFSISTLGFIPFLLICYRMAKVLRLSEQIAAEVVLILGFLPSYALFFTTPLREPWKLLFLALFVYASIKYFEAYDIRQLLLWLLSSVLLVLIHKAYAIIVPMLILITFIVLGSKFSLSLKPRQLLGIGVIMVLIPLVANYWSSLPYEILQVIGSEDALDWASETRSTLANSQRDNRANYGLTLNTSSVPQLLLTGIPVYVFYLASPFPWQVSSVVDLLGFSDSTLGLIFLSAAIMTFRGDKLSRKGLFIYLLAVFLLVTMTHALGTINYGTAMRHRINSTWICVILGWPYLRQRFFSRLLPH